MIARMTPDELLEDFKRSYENAFDKRLSDEEARELQEELLHLYKVVLRRSTPPGEEPRPPRPPWENQPIDPPLSEGPQESI
jgi:hypothetical protein